MESKLRWYCSLLISWYFGKRLLLADTGKSLLEKRRELRGISVGYLFSEGIWNYK